MIINRIDFPTVIPHPGVVVSTLPDRAVGTVSRNDVQGGT